MSTVHMFFPPSLLYLSRPDSVVFVSIKTFCKLDVLESLKIDNKNQPTNQKTTTQ